MSHSDSKADLVIVGAGMVGLAIAYEAARTGKRVVVLERDHVGAGAAGVAAGMLAPASELENEDRPLLEFALTSCRLYPEFVRAVELDSGLPCQYRTEGTLLVALHRDHLEELERLARLQATLGLNAHWLTAAELQDREPTLSSRTVGGLFAEDDRQVNPRALLRALVAAIQRRGGAIVTGARDVRLVTHGSALVGVEYVREGVTTTVEARNTVVATGAFAGELLSGLGLGTFPLRPVKGQILRLRGKPLLQHVVRTAEVYLVPRIDGELVVGATSEEQGFDSRMTAGAVLDLLQEAWRVLPGIAELELAELGAGFRPAFRDNLPVIGPGPLDGLYLAVGHYRHGVMLAPVTARLLIETMESGKLPPALLPFQLDRFGMPSPQSAEGALSV